MIYLDYLVYREFKLSIDLDLVSLSSSKRECNSLKINKKKQQANLELQQQVIPP